MRGFLGKVRTDGRTNGRESIGLQESRFLETKNTSKVFCIPKMTSYGDMNQIHVKIGIFLIFFDRISLLSLANDSFADKYFILSIQRH